MIRAGMIDFGAGAPATAGCTTFNFAGARPTLTTVSTPPPGAFDMVESFGEREAPCTIEINRPREILIAKAGFDQPRLILEAGRKRVDVFLELTSPTTGVDETALPDL